MTLKYCCERFQKRPSWIVSPAADDHVRCGHRGTLMLRGTWSEGQRRILQECPVDGEDVASDLGMLSDFFIFEQDSAPAHRAKDTIAFLRRETPSFIGPELWPANSPDLNPVDYRIWGLIQERIYQTAIRDIDELKERLIVVWAE